MSWVAAAVVGGSIVGGVITSSGAKSAANTQAASADRATQLQSDQYWQTREDQAPYRDLATQVALPGIRTFLANNSGQLTAAQVMSDPGYQFGLDQGLKSLQGTAAARGSLYSGATLKAINRFGNDYATNKFDDSYNRQETSRTNEYNRLASAAGIGQIANNQVAAAGANYANSAGSNIVGAGNAQAAAGLSGSNAWANALNSGISSYGRYAGSSGAATGGAAGNAGYGNYSDPSWFGSVTPTY